LNHNFKTPYYGKYKTPVVITVETKVNAPIGKVWKYWTEPEHIKKWNNAFPTGILPQRKMITRWRKIYKHNGGQRWQHEF